MKRLLFALIICCVTGVAALAKGAPEISFDAVSHDFGTIREADGDVTCTFKFTNTGTAPLALTSVSAPCNCTKTHFSPKPLAPGKSGEITVTFSPKNMSGEFMRSISVWTNVKTDKNKKKKVILKISGAVVPKK